MCAMHGAIFIISTTIRKGIIIITLSYWWENCNSGKLSCRVHVSELGPNTGSLIPVLRVWEHTVNCFFIILLTMRHPPSLHTWGLGKDYQRTTEPSVTWGAERRPGIRDSKWTNMVSRQEQQIEQISSWSAEIMDSKCVQAPTMNAWVHKNICSASSACRKGTQVPGLSQSAGGVKHPHISASALEGALACVRAHGALPLCHSVSLSRPHDFLNFFSMWEEKSVFWLHSYPWMNPRRRGRTNTGLGSKSQNLLTTLPSIIPSQMI